MKTQRWLTILHSLLIVGTLIAPVPSEAVPTLTFTVDDVPGAVSLLPSTCSSSDKTAGYTACYSITTVTPAGFIPNTFTLQNVSSTNPARLLIADTTGAGTSLDLLTLTGVKFVPGSTLTGQHTVRVTYMNTFDAAANPTGTYLFAMRTGGYFVAGAGATTGTVDNINNFLSLKGFGNFGSSSGDILPPLSMQVGGPSSTTVSFSLGQVQPYPSFNCNTGGNCGPTITQTLTFVVDGRDTLFLTNSANGAGGNCDVVPPNVPPSPPFDLPPGPVSPCQARAGRINSFFNKTTAADNKSASQAGAVPFIPCGPNECPCVDPDTCFAD